ncbi:MAG: hypothetical protein HYS33_09875 [Acidobacteria bacterium]|nr:hypothetical protein [Acidobacteriota bacterium]
MRVRFGIAFSLALAGLVLAKTARVAGEEVSGHPFIAPDDLTSETCLSCHPNKSEGEFVHSAIPMGCEKCHQAASEREKTTIKVLASDGELCAKCHAAEPGPVLHTPYKRGQCLVCHNPHSSGFPGQSRAAVSTLCMSCHGANQPNVKIDSDARTVSLLGGRTIGLETYEEAAKISDPHPRSGTASKSAHPPVKTRSQDSDAALNCLSCHEAHSSQRQYLLQPVL